MILSLPKGNLNYYVRYNYKLWGDVGVSFWLEIRTWNLLGQVADKLHVPNTV